MSPVATYGNYTEPKKTVNKPMFFQNNDLTQIR